MYRQTTGTDLTIRHIPKFGGELWFVSADGGNDSYVGTAPDLAFATIGAAITAASSGDAITIMAGTYTETSIDLNKNYVELWFEIGAIIDPTGTTALTISGHYCKIKGSHNISVDAGEIGLLITGNMCDVSDGIITTGDTGIKITGTGTQVSGYRCGNQTNIAYDVQGDQTRLIGCSTKGLGASFGYKITAGADTGVLNGCTSVGHTEAGYYFYTGSTDWTILNCSSGADDGRWIDQDSSNVWSNFLYEEEKFSTSTFTATGGVGSTGTNYNLFKVDGSVEVYGIVGHVTTVIPAVASNINLELYSTSGSDDITATGTPIASLVVGATLVKESDSTDILDVGNPDTVPVIIENASYRSPDTPIILVEDDSASTYIQAVLTVAQASGAIKWHVHWKPLTSDGFLTAV